MFIFRLFIATLLLLPVLDTQLKAHEFWIEPEKYLIAPDSGVRANLRNGQEFNGSDLSWFDRRNVRVENVFAGKVRKITGRAGDIPALQVPAPGSGLMVLVHQSEATLLTYKDWDTVLSFAAHKDFPWFAQRHRTRGLPEDAVTEVYTRFSKSLVGFGGAKGQDQAVGLEVEIVALANPYTDDLGGGLPVKVIYRDTPQPDVQVEAYAKAPDGTVTLTQLRTDAQGQALVPVIAGHSYLIDHVVLREPDPATNYADKAMWESLWASLTFAVPD
ncbi:MAG: DUF4198 domain-containing protein [Pseudooceanicola sp.]